MKKYTLIICINERIIIPTVLMLVLATPTFSASVPDTACDLIYDATPGVEVGNGGQDYITNVEMAVYNSELPDGGKYAGDFDIYDWNGDLVERVSGDYELSMSKREIVTGLVDGTYTFVLDDTYKGTFNIDHEMQALVGVDMAYYNYCNHDAYGSYIDPNTIYEPTTDTIMPSSSIEGGSTSEENIEEFDVSKNEDNSNAADQTSSSNEIGQKSGYMILIVAVIIILGLIAVIIIGLSILYTLKKSNKS